MDSLESENSDMKIMLWRMIQKHGNSISNEHIDPVTASIIHRYRFSIRGDSDKIGEPIVNPKIVYGMP